MLISASARMLTGLNSRNNTLRLILPSIRGSRFISTHTKTRGFIKRLVAEKQAEVVIPKRLVNTQLQLICKTVYTQRLGRLGGTILYPSMSLASMVSGSLPNTIGWLAYTPFCVGLHHMAINRASIAARDLIQRKKVFNGDWANKELEKWMNDMGIDHLSFDDDGNIVLSKQLQFTPGKVQVWLDQSRLEESNNTFSPWKFFKDETKQDNVINFYHLDEKIQKQVSFLMKERSKRFRAPVLLGASGFTLACLSKVNHPIFGLFIGAYLGQRTNHNQVSEDSDRLFSLIEKMHGVQEIIALEYQHLYQHLSGKDDNITVCVNTFGDIEINPILSLRAKRDISFSKLQK